MKTYPLHVKTTDKPEVKSPNLTECRHTISIQKSTHCSTRHVVDTQI